MRACVQDMVVEYLSAVVATSMQFFWAHTGLFMLGIPAADATSRLTTTWFVTVLLIQLAPELIADAWCIWLELTSGQQSHVFRFWKLQFADRGLFGIKACCVLMMIGILPLVLLKIV